jgi:hypothetical protein
MLKRVAVSLVVCSLASSAFALGPVAKHLGVGAPSPLDTDPPSTAIPPVPVAVQNFPATQAVVGTVSIDNLPAVQAVSGTVQVGNLPATQQVGGTVSVSNLPLDGDGAVRVSSAPAPARLPAVTDLLSEPIDCNGEVVLPVPIRADTYAHVGVAVIGEAPGQLQVSVLSRWGDDEDFRPVNDYRNGVTVYGASGCWGNADARLICPSPGGEIAVQLSCPSPRSVIKVRVYLIP